MSSVSIEIFLYGGGRQKKIACWWENNFAQCLLNESVFGMMNIQALEWWLWWRSHGHRGKGSKVPALPGWLPGGLVLAQSWRGLAAFDDWGLPLVTKLPREAPSMGNSFWSQSKLWNTKQPSGLFSVLCFHHPLEAVLLLLAKGYGCSWLNSLYDQLTLWYSLAKSSAFSRKR